VVRRNADQLENKKGKNAENSDERDEKRAVEKR
jgi:hypothetical protein